MSNSFIPDVGSEVTRIAGFARWIIRRFGIRQKRRLGFLVIPFLICIASPAFACPMCKDSTLDNGRDVRPGDKAVPAAQSAALDFNKSIYIMLGGFVGVLGFAGRVMYQAARSSSR